MIAWRKRRVVPVSILIVYFGWLFGISRLGLAGLAVIGESLWLRLAWLIVISSLAFGPPIFLLRRLTSRLDRTR